MGPGVLWWSDVLDSALPPQRLRPDPGPGHQDPASHTAWKKSNKKKQNKTKQKKNRNKRTDKTPAEMVKAKLNRQNHPKKHTHVHLQKEKTKKRATKPINNPKTKTNSKN